MIDRISQQQESGGMTLGGDHGVTSSGSASMNQLHQEIGLGMMNRRALNNANNDDDHNNNYGRFRNNQPSLYTYN